MMDKTPSFIVQGQQWYSNAGAVAVAQDPNSCTLALLGRINKTFWEITESQV